MRHLLSQIGFIFLYLSSFSQSPVPTNYPSNYFRDPLNIPIKLAANFGELRPNHFHMGLDIRTENRENLPVLAAADGYIARIRVEPFGFGQAIYIHHPNGYTTVYGHLKEFFPALSAYIRRQQYKKESWEISLDLPPGLFPVKKGDLIAHSGNTGGSQGPHLHFEIRRTADEVNLNPMLFGLSIPDNTPPVIQRLAIYDGFHSIYEQSPQILSLTKKGDGYGPKQDTVICFSARAGFAIGAFDTQSGSSNPNGIYEVSLLEDGQNLLDFRMDQISYEHTLDVNGHIDYRTRSNGGPYLQQLFHLSGLGPSIYHLYKGDGFVDLSDGATHAIQILVKDAYGNQSKLSFLARYVPTQTLPRIAIGKEFYPSMTDGFETGDCEFFIPEKSLYDSVHIGYLRLTEDSPESFSAIHRIGARHIPLQNEILVRIKPDKEIPEQKKDKILMQWSSGSARAVSKVEWKSGWASARFGRFGDFRLVLDEFPPLIRVSGYRDGANLKKASRLAFFVKDNLGSVAYVRAEIDGKWIRFTNDKAKAFIYIFDEHCGRGSHVLKITAHDEAGNSATQLFHFTR